MAILEILRQEATPIDVITLAQKLGHIYAERSVRRWLAEMVTEGHVLKFGHTKGVRYQANLKLGCFSSESLDLVAQVRRPMFERDLSYYADIWLQAYKPNETYYMPVSVQEQLYQAGQRAHIADPVGTYAHQIFNRLLIDLSYNSSRLEGNTFTLLETQQLLLKHKSVDGKLAEEKTMILNHKEAICYLVDNAPHLKVSTETICTVHYLLSEGLLERHYSGKIRDYRVRIGGSAYLPIEDKTVLQYHLTVILEKAAQIKNPYEQSFFLLIHISYLQAFADVNKRTARLCANLPLIKKNVVPLTFTDVAREDYSAAMLVVYELQDVRPLLDVYVQSYLKTCQQYDSTIEEIGVDVIRVKYRAQRRTLLHDIIVNKLSGAALEDYVREQSPLRIPESDAAAFMITVQDDIKEMEGAHIVGLGITLEQFQAWRALQS